MRVNFRRSRGARLPAAAHAREHKDAGGSRRDQTMVARQQIAWLPSFSPSAGTKSDNPFRDETRQHPSG
jgi:hypothetical protein